MHKRLWLVLSLVLSLFVLPDVAYARDVDVIGSFGSGMDVMLHPESYSQRDEPVENERNDAMLAASPNSNSIAQNAIQRFVIFGLTIQVDSGVFRPTNWITALLRYFTVWSPTKAMFVASVAFVFVWWGLRKSIRMIFRAFRKGRING